jgi:PAS domain S-box-containing protein
MNPLPGIRACDRDGPAAAADGGSLLTGDELIRTAFANAAIGFSMTRPDGRFVAANPAYCALTGYGPDELVTMNVREVVHPDDLPENEALLARMLRGELADFVLENRYRRKTGEPVWVRKSCSLVRDDRGAPRGMVALVEDVSERRQVEQSLRESELRARLRAAELEAVLDTVPAAVCFARDPRGDRIDANRYGAELLRMRPGDNVSVSSSPGSDRTRNFVFEQAGVRIPDDEFPIQRAARRGEEVRGAEMDLRFTDGEVRHLLGNAAPLRDEHGVTKGSVGAFIDITERKRAEEALREADRRKTEFLALLSHELRNPLAPIRNGLLVLEQVPPDSEPARRAREVLRRQTAQLSRLVDDLLELSRISHGKIEVQLARLDAREVARRACADLRGLFEERGVELFVAEAEEPIWVDADGARLAQMLGNLLHNALKFTPPRGRVRVEAARRGGACELTVRDSGVGLAPGELDRIFEPFIQAARSTGVEGGLGLGLALVRELAAKHGGTVRAESEGPGKGAAFVVALPLAAAPAGAVPGGPEPGCSAAVRVLIVDDNADAGTTLADLLALGGHAVTVALTGAEAIAAVAAAPPEVLLCDIGLPDMSGHDVIRAIRGMPAGRGIHAVALTGYALPGDRDAALAAGFDAHFPKPAPTDGLLAVLAAASRSAGRP